MPPLPTALRITSPVVPIRRGGAACLGDTLRSPAQREQRTTFKNAIATCGMQIGLGHAPQPRPRRNVPKHSLVTRVMRACDTTTQRALASVHGRICNTVARAARTSVLKQRPTTPFAWKNVQNVPLYLHTLISGSPRWRSRMCRAHSVDAPAVYRFNQSPRTSCLSLFTA